MKVKVRDGTQVNINGKVYSGGKTLEVDEVTAARLLARGLVEEDKRKKD
jgi:hypothetical protein